MCTPMSFTGSAPASGGSQRRELGAVGPRWGPQRAAAPPRIRGHRPGADPPRRGRRPAGLPRRVGTRVLRRPRACPYWWSQRNAQATPGAGRPCACYGMGGRGPPSAEHAQARTLSHRRASRRSLWRSLSTWLRTSREPLPKLKLPLQQNEALVDAQNGQKPRPFCGPGLKTSLAPVCNTNRC